MQKYLFLFLVMPGQMYGMHPTSPGLCRDSKDKPVTIIVAAWATTSETPLHEHSEVRIWQLPGGRTMSYTCRPKSVWEKPISIKTVIEFTPLETSSEYPLLLSCSQEQIVVTQCEKPWYKHPVATHSAAVLSTILLMGALFR